MRRAFIVTALLLIGVIAGACDSRHAWEGRYSGRPEGGDPAAEVILTLESGGKGHWQVAGEERGGALWMHLKSGGVMTARPLPGQAGLAIDLPGIGSFTLRKAAR
ncbi:MAG: hypothetical protein MUC46_00690 [Desulfobacterales bacterium]|nr:hypothetical protein [Desulfobacterales bacterium]